MWGFAQGGMSAIEAIRSATLTPATALGLDKDLGSIEVGKLADLVIIDANVTDDIFKSDKVDMVMMNGRLYDAATLNEKVTGDHKTQTLLLAEVSSSNLNFGGALAFAGFLLYMLAPQEVAADEHDWYQYESHIFRRQ